MILVTVFKLPRVSLHQIHPAFRNVYPHNRLHRSVFRIRQHRERTQTPVRGAARQQKRASALSAQVRGKQDRERVHTDPEMQRGVRIDRQTGVYAELPPAPVSRPLYPCMCAHFLEDRATRHVCAAPPKDPRVKRMGSSVARDTGVDTETVRKDVCSVHVCRRHALLNPVA